jgi:hypothetical protein
LFFHPKAHLRRLLLSSFPCSINDLGDAGIGENIKPGSQGHFFVVRPEIQDAPFLLLAVSKRFIFGTRS